MEFDMDRKGRRHGQWEEGDLAGWWGRDKGCRG